MNNKGIIPIVVALAMLLATGFGIVVGNCKLSGGTLACHGLGK